MVLGRNKGLKSFQSAVYPRSFIRRILKSLLTAFLRIAICGAKTWNEDKKCPEIFIMRMKQASP